MIPQLDVSDTALAKMVAQATADTPGVARLAPNLASRIKDAAVRAVRQVTAPAIESARHADPAAVDIEEPSDTTPLTVTIRIIATGDPPVIATLAAIHHTVTATLKAAGHPDSAVTVIVIGTEP
ncbi:MAG: hypothetical protein M3Y77_16780 [Actinomycetota bacterium]|nr:hypothetical protein [Actinomycetota bacterium]